MTTKRITYIIFMLLPLAVCGISLFFLPDNIPAHYGSEMTADRWGSKYESLIFPACIIGFGLFMLLVSKLAGKFDENNKQNEKIVLTVGLVVLIIFNAMNLFFEYLFVNQITDMSDLPIDLLSLIITLFGVGFIIIGNILPKARMNSLLGFRTAWTMKNEVTWKKCQLFGGIMLMLNGIIIAVGCLLFFKGNSAVFFMLAMIAVMTIIDAVYSYFIMKKYGNLSDNPDNEPQ
ncbi:MULTISPECIES: SdpI family protein [unclassified Ruminococcus]|uniref:SdpI family protein n=1 Tax=unclassified Ruminococcus TaxID=2608920 RepID=UPI00210DEBA0|nr:MULTISPECIES: SdpI family protein [unclassified Ruminococcus]